MPHRRIARLLIVVSTTGLFCACSTAMRGDLLDDLNQALYYRSPDESFHLRLSGLLDLESYYFNLPPPALIESENRFLFNPRLTLFGQAQFGRHFYVATQVRVDRGFDPSDEGLNIRADEYLFRITPLDSAAVNIQLGKFATVIGNWVPRHYSWDNPFVNAPLPYENLTALWDSAAPFNLETLLYWGHIGNYDSGDYSDKYLRLPIIWGPNYASGAAIMGAVGQFSYAAEIKNAALASRPESWDVTQQGFTHPTFSGRIALAPNEMWTFGISASSGAYLLPQAAATLPAGRDIGDYRELVLGQDVAFAWHHLQLWAEVFETRFEVPRLGDADVLAYYLEAKYRFGAQTFVALRWNQELFATVHDRTKSAAWGNNTSRIDAALGYRFTSYLQAKLQYSFQNAASQHDSHLFATQLTFKF